MVHTHVERLKRLLRSSEDRRADAEAKLAHTLADAEAKLAHALADAAAKQRERVIKICPMPRAGSQMLR